MSIAYISIKEDFEEINTKKIFDDYFKKKNIKVSDDADIMLYFIGKKIDLELKNFILKNNKKGASSTKLLTQKLKEFQKNIKIFCELAVEHMENELINIQTIKMILKNLCPLWPIC